MTTAEDFTVHVELSADEVDICIPEGCPDCAGPVFRGWKGAVEIGIVHHKPTCPTVPRGTP